MFVRVRETNLKHVILERSMQYVLTPDAGSVPNAGHVAQTAVVIDDDLGFSARKKERKKKRSNIKVIQRFTNQPYRLPEARTASHLRNQPVRTGTAVHVAHHRPTVRGQREPQKVPRVLNRHPRRRGRKHPRDIRRIPRSVVVQHPYPAHLARFPLLPHPQQHTAGHYVRRNQIRPPKQRAQQTCHLRERLVAKLVLPQAAKSPPESAEPQLRHLPVDGRLGGTVVVAVAAVLVLGRPERIKHYR